VRADGSEKPAAAELRALAASSARGVPPHLLDVSADEYYRDPAGHARRLYQRWLEETR
jgi:hypothetical protein